jgi:hypothetical protein
MVSPQVPQEEYPLTDEARLSDSMRRPSPFAATGRGRGLQANYEIWSGQLLLDRFKFLS